MVTKGKTGEMAPVLRSGRQHIDDLGRRSTALRAAGFLLAGVGSLGVPNTGAAQDPPARAAAAPSSWHLSVQPRAMATATRTPHAGWYTTGLPRHYEVYVPPQCVGARRCPLMVTIDGEERARHRQPPLADKYGMILLVVQGTMPFAGNAEAPQMDVALKHILRTFVIDPEKIAINGNSNQTAYSWPLFHENPEVFSRHFSVESYDELRSQQGPIRRYQAFRTHMRSARDVNRLFGWVAASWGLPGAPTLPAAPPADSVPLLTVDLLTRLATFWQTFAQGLWDRHIAVPVWLHPAFFHDDPDLAAPDGFARLGVEKLLPVYAGDSTPVWAANMGDIPALAAQHPGVAAGLARAGLSAAEEEAGRAAYVGARLAIAYNASNPVLLGPLAKNMVLLCAHPTESRTLDELIGIVFDRPTFSEPPCWRNKAGTP